jgi:AraC-like DNA-binding protein
MVTRMSIILIADPSSFADYRALDLSSESVHVIGFSDDLVIFMEADPELVLIDSGDSADLGVRMLERIKKVRNDLPVIFVAGESSEELVLRAFRAGAREYLKKPVQPAELKATVLSILDLRRQTPGKRMSLQAARNRDAKTLAPYLGDLPTNIFRAAKFIETNISASLNLETIAREASLSRFHFSRVFKVHVGMSPKQYTLMLRVNRSLTLLRNPDLTISTVALRAGFNELGEFTRQFRKIIGLTPSAFRDTIKIDVPPRNSK